MERFRDRIGNHYSVWLATSIHCCFPRPQERPPLHVEEEVEEEMTMGHETTTVPIRAKTIKRQSPIPVSKYNKHSICYQQPQRRSQLAWSVSKKEDPLIQLPRPVSRRHEPQGPERRQSLASRASQRIRSRPRKSTSRCPTSSDLNDISRDASFDFILNGEDLPRAVSPLQRRLSPFRPIQLSIYLPGKELPALPKFSDDDDDDNNNDDVPTVPGIERPPQALMITKWDPMLNRRLSSFSIPRKPVGGSRASSLELAPAPRPSIDSGLTLNNNDAALSTHKRSSSIDRLRSDHRPTLSATKSSQEFLEIINAPLPPLPQSTSTSHQNRDDLGAKPAFSIYKSASDQNMRLRTHLEERQEVCDTISEKEERSPVSPLTPPQAPVSAFATFHRPSSTASRSSQIYVQQSFQQRDSLIHPAHRLGSINNNNNKNTATVATQPTWTDSGFELPLPNFHKARSSSGSSTLNEKMTDAGFLQHINDADIIRPTVTTTISVCPSTPTLSHRLSQWLTNSIPTRHNFNTNSTGAATRDSIHGNGIRSSSTWDLSRPAPLSIGPGAVVLPGEVKKSRSVPGRKTNLTTGTGLTKLQQQSNVNTVMPIIRGESSNAVDKISVAIVTERPVSGVGMAF